MLFYAIHLQKYRAIWSLAHRSFVRALLPAKMNHLHLAVSVVCIYNRQHLRNAKLFEILNERWSNCLPFAISTVVTTTIIMINLALGRKNERIEIKRIFVLCRCEATGSFWCVCSVTRQSTLDFLLLFYLVKRSEPFLCCTMKDKIQWLFFMCIWLRRPRHHSNRTLRSFSEQNDSEWMRGWYGAITLHKPYTQRKSYYDDSN